MSAMDKFVANLPGRMESHPSHRALAHPYGAIQQIDLEEHSVCDPLQEEEESQLVGGDPESYRLHVEFVHAHGIPKGAITTLLNACTATAATVAPNGRKAAGGT
jgi:hypothetical protein